MIVRRLHEISPGQKPCACALRLTVQGSSSSLPPYISAMAPTTWFSETRIFFYLITNAIFLGLGRILLFVVARRCAPRPSAEKRADRVPAEHIRDYPRPRRNHHGKPLRDSQWRQGGQSGVNLADIHQEAREKKNSRPMICTLTAEGDLGLEIYEEKQPRI